MWLGLTTGDWISVVGTLVSLVGLLVVFIQVQRVGGAVRNQQQQTAGVLLLSRTGDLERIEFDLRVATGPRAATTKVQEWRRNAAELRSLLENADRGNEALHDALTLSLGLVDETLQALAAKEVNVQAALGPILREIGSVCVESRAIGAGMMIERKP